MKVLIIDDEPHQAEHVASAVEACGFEYDIETTERGGCARLMRGGYDIAIVDIRLGEGDGKDILLRARSKRVRTHLVVLSSHAGEADKISAFSMGADDFLAKPVSRDELVMRLKAVARRLTPSSGPEILRGRGVVICVDTREVRRNGQILNLTPRETDLLILLMRNKGSTVPTDMISDYVWGGVLDPDSSVIMANVCRLRKKLRLDDEEDVIHTVRDIGYVFR